MQQSVLVGPYIGTGGYVLFTCHVDVTRSEMKLKPGEVNAAIKKSAHVRRTLVPWWHVSTLAYTHAASSRYILIIIMAPHAGKGNVGHCTLTVASQSCLLTSPHRIACTFLPCTECDRWRSQRFAHTHARLLGNLFLLPWLLLWYTITCCVSTLIFFLSRALLHVSRVNRHATWLLVLLLLSGPFFAHTAYI